MAACSLMACMACSCGWVGIQVMEWGFARGWASLSKEYEFMLFIEMLLQVLASGLRRLLNSKTKHSWLLCLQSRGRRAPLQKYLAFCKPQPCLHEHSLTKRGSPTKACCKPPAKPVTNAPPACACASVGCVRS